MELEYYDETKKLSKEQENLLHTLLEYAANFIDLPINTGMSLTIVDNERIHEINRAYRGVDRPTDVISFALQDGDEDDGIDLSIFEDLPNEIGDIFISIEKVAEQAKDYGHSFDRELGFLAVHGFLHLNSYDHMNESDEKEMFSLQDEILGGYGLER